MFLVRPTAEHLPGYIAALQRGWSPETARAVAAQEELAQIEADPALFLARQDDREAKGPPIVLPDGTTVPRLPGYKRWIWDGEFCGVISFRWQPGTTALPPQCLGHIGYSVVPWKQGHGYASRALALFLSEVRTENLPFVEITTDLKNTASQRVIEKNGGVLVEQFRKSAHYDGADALRFRINFDQRTSPQHRPEHEA